MEQALPEFVNHLDECNAEFKEKIMSKMITMKDDDKTRLENRIEDLKDDETNELNNLNDNYNQRRKEECYLDKRT